MVSDKNEKRVIGNWRKGNPYYKAKEKWAELCLCSVFCVEYNL